MEQNINELLKSAKETLSDAGISYGRDAEFILEYIIGDKIPSGQILSISAEQLSRFKELIKRRASHEPLDSILGGTEFMGLNIPFNKDILTPRQETELMTDAIIRENKSTNNLKVLDLCCGSGCIGLALKRHLNYASVTLSDISESALQIAKDNAKLNNIDVVFIKSDLFQNIADKFDIIVSNPPYIPTRDIKDLEVEVRDYDPMLALDGGEDGMEIYRKIAEDIPRYLKDDGRVYIEFGIDQTEGILDIFNGKLKDMEIIKDYSGIDRYLKARK